MTRKKVKAQFEISKSKRPWFVFIDGKAALTKRGAVRRFATEVAATKAGLRLLWMVK